MMQSNTTDQTVRAAASRPARKRPMGRLGIGILVSVTLHIVVASLLVLGLIVGPKEAPLVIPVDLILADQASSPPETNEASVPTEQAAAPSSPKATPVMLAPSATTKAQDELDLKLHKLAQLRQPTLNQHLSKMGDGIARVSTTTADAVPGSEAAFKNFLRDQIEHHWGLDLEAIHHRSIIVTLRMAITRAGIVRRADVLNKREAGLDPTFDEAARSARNAALLSSPLTMPPGHYPETMQVILNVNTRDGLR